MLVQSVFSDKPLSRVATSVAVEAANRGVAINKVGTRSNQQLHLKKVDHGIIRLTLDLHVAGSMAKKKVRTLKPNLVRTWIAAQRERGLTAADCARELSSKFELVIDASRISNWQRGRGGPNRAIIDYMQSTAIPHLLPEESKATHKRLIAGLSVADEVD